MRMRKQLIGAMAAVAAWLVVGGTAIAAFPNFSGCPVTAPEDVCINVQNRSGNLNIKGFNVPLGESLEIRGRVQGNETPILDFIPPRGTNGFFSTPVSVPGGLLGIEFPIPGNAVLAITELAGPSSGIDINVAAGSITIPIKVRLVNVLLGMNCHIGSDSNPVVLNLITGTTSPPPPNRPISGRFGEPTFGETLTTITGNVNVDNTFGVPRATRCGLGLGLINALVDLKLRLPSAAGNNSIEVVNDVAIGLP